MHAHPRHNQDIYPQAHESCWTITSGKVGCQRQARGLAQALRLDHTEKTTQRAPQFAWLPPTWHWGALRQQHPRYESLEPPWPKWLIACGYRTIPMVLAIQAASRGHTKSIFIQNPHIKPHHFTWVVTGKHDQLTGNNVMQHLGALHDLTPDNIAAATKANTHWHSKQPRPILCILLGGNTKHHTMSAIDIKASAAMCQSVCATWRQQRGKDAACLLLPSRRTPKTLINAIHATCLHPNDSIVAQQIDAPYLTCLGIADTIMVSNDSCSMISESCITGKPVYILPLPGFSPRAKFQRFIQSMVHSKHCQHWSGHFFNWHPLPLNEAKRVAEAMSQVPAGHAS